MELIRGIDNQFSYLHYFRSIRQNWFDDLMKYREIKRIFKHDLITTFFQPIKNIQTDETIGYEALNRPPVSKWIPNTEQFYEYIGRTNKIFLFEMYCRHASIKNFSKNIEKQPSEKGKLLFINIQPDVLIDSKYKPGETIQLIREFGLQPEQIVFELTEKKALTDFKMFEKVMYNYRAQGFRLAVDDAGSGYNSLKTLVHLRPEFIKLDRSLIHNISQNEAQQKMVSLLLDYANQLNTFVIAEGIEETEDLHFLKTIGIHFGQGYALGHPNRCLAPPEICRKNQLA